MVKPARAMQSRRPVSRKRKRKWIARLFTTVAVLTVVGLVAGVAAVAVAYNTIETPDPNEDFQTQTSFIYYGDNKTKMGNLAIQNRQSIPYDEMPQTIKDAVVAAENETFWEDPGISIPGLIRSAWVIARGGDLQGGSTITQQYIKIMYLTSDQTLTRKFKELLLSMKISKTVHKQTILESYLNTIYFGRGAYGIQAASRSYFNVDAKDLTVPQAAVLASVVNNPSIFDPSEHESNAERLLGRYQYAIQRMAETGKITAEEAVEYKEKLPKFPKIPINERYGGPQGFLMKMVEGELQDIGFGPEQISGGGLRVTTTFDKRSQDAAVKTAQKYTKQAAKAADRKKKNLHAAVASVDVDSGEVIALYGGPDYIKDSRNWATTPRSTASTFKTYALAAGLEDGYSLYSRFNGNTFTPPGDSSTVRNEFSMQYGKRVNLIKSTAESINTAFVDMTGQMESGAQKVMEAAEVAGAAKGPGWDENDRVSLGTAEVSPLGQASAYATYANGGKQIANHVIREVQDSEGKTLYKATPTETQAVSGAIADDVTYALSSVVEEGTGKKVQTIGRPVAGKTGTAGVGDEIKSAWFVAYTKQISTAVMYVAGKDGNGDLDPYKRPGDNTFFGGTYPALTWADYMEVATKGQPVKEFDPPAFVNQDKYPSPSPKPKKTKTPKPTAQTTTKVPDPPETKDPEPTESQQPPTSPPRNTTKPDPTPEPTDDPTSTPKLPGKPPKTKTPLPSESPQSSTILTEQTQQASSGDGTDTPAPSDVG